MNIQAVNIDLIHEIGADFCIRSRCYPVSLEGSLFTIAIEKSSQLLLEALELRTEKQIQFVKVTASILEDQIRMMADERNGRKGDNVLSGLIQSEIAINDETSIEEIRKKSQAEPVVKLVNEIIEQAIAEGATDIHVEPAENKLKIRYRKDGMLRDSLELPKWVQASVISRIKILSELDIAEKRLPQDGRIKWATGDNTIDMRVSTLPTRLGEKVVIRILIHASYVSNISSLGMPSEVLKSVRSQIHRPQGMIFVTGPTGSGKTSTLYACLNEILSKDINVSTIEDPIEYRMDGANQVQINEKAGLTFAGILRSLLRQDPDVMLIGEIRDEETARIAIQAAQTGHLVFSTLHTNDSVSAITRLLDLKIKPFLVSSAVLGILAQRLLRKVCTQCVSMEPPSVEERSFLPGLPDVCPTAKGCNRCGYTGYNGRTGIFEWLPFENAVKEAVVEGKAESHIKSVSSMVPLAQDGLNKIKEGITTAAELMRVATIED